MRLVRVICPRKSAGAMRLTRALRERLPNRVLRTKDLTRVRRNDIIVNWGCSEFPWPNGAAINAINHPWAVYNCVNKVRTYEVLSRAGLDRYLPMHTTDMYDAQRMLDEGTVICVRHLTEAHGGRGIEIVSEGQLPVAPLYTEYVPKKDEYRVHVDPWGVWVQKKMGRTGADRNYQVRNHENGWVYAVNHERASDAPEPVLEAGEAAVRVLSGPCT